MLANATMRTVEVVSRLNERSSDWEQLWNGYLDPEIVRIEAALRTQLDGVVMRQLQGALQALYALKDLKNTARATLRDQRDNSSAAQGGNTDCWT
jgi:hypothetical protein